MFFYCGLVDQHDRDIVVDRVAAMTLVAPERGTVLHEPHGRLAFRTHQNLEERRIDSHVTNLTGSVPFGKAGVRARRGAGAP